MSWNPPSDLEYYFTPTRTDSYSEIRKADIKNHNLPILQYWFNGNKKKPLVCSITKTVGFMEFPDIATGKKKQRFVLDYNHIRQKQGTSNHSGFSVDKGEYSPSALIREARLDRKTWALVEMMTTMPVNSMYHSFISQDSQKANITLANFKKSWWPWGLKNKKNFDKFCKEYGVSRIKYDKFISALSEIDSLGYPIVEQWQLGFLK